MPSVVGLDLSLTNTGIALVSSSGRAVCSRVASAGKRADSLAQRRRRLRELRDGVLTYVGLPDLVVVERQIGQSTGSTHDRSGLWWDVVGRLLDREVPVVEVVPQHVKIYIVGKGSGLGTSKSEVTAAAVKRYGGLVEIADDNEADALGLADMGARWLGWPLPVEIPKRNLEVMAKVAWPDQ